MLSQPLPDGGAAVKLLKLAVCPHARSPQNQMKAEADREFLKYLLSKRKVSGPREYKFSWLDITSAEREKLYEIGEQSGLLTHYEFSGIKAAGTSRNDAARRVLDKTRERAFLKLKTELGRTAHFWFRPRQLSSLYIDFYWRKAKVGVVVTGPLMDDLWHAGRKRIGAFRFARNYFSNSPPELRNLTILVVSYYTVWHQPSEFVAAIKEQLIASGHYPRLSA
jgi:hypothetical protein